MARTPRTPKKPDGDPPPAAPEGVKRSRRHPKLEAAIGARLRALRIAARMSQTALGTAVGISFQQVQKYELGKDRIAVSTLQSLASALGVHPGSFFGDNAPVMSSRSITDVRDVVRIGQRIQRVRDPGIVKRMLALADLLAGLDGEQPTDAAEAL